MPLMGSILRLFFPVTLLKILFIVLLSLADGVNGIHEQDLQAMLSALRSRGYNLFGNAITTSDIHYEILSGSSFTFFAPTDSALFALDMTATASNYVQTLRCHIVPRRFSMANLRSLHSGSPLHTLIHHHDIHIAGRWSPDSYIITANGVDIVLPGLFYTRDIAVHGLGGIQILHHRAQIGSPQAPPPFANFLPKSLDKSPDLSPGPESSLDRISPISSPESLYLSPVQQTLSPISTDASPPYQSPSPAQESPFPNPPEYGSRVDLTGPPFNDDLPPMASKFLAPAAASPEGGYPWYASLDPHADSFTDRVSRREPRMSGKCEVSRGMIRERMKDLQTSSGIFLDNSAMTPMLPPLREGQVDEIPVISWPLDDETGCPVMADGN